MTTLRARIAELEEELAEKDAKIEEAGHYARMARERCDEQNKKLEADRKAAHDAWRSVFSQFTDQDPEAHIIRLLAPVFEQIERYLPTDPGRRAATLGRLMSYIQSRWIWADPVAVAVQANPNQYAHRISRESF